VLDVTPGSQPRTHAPQHAPTGRTRGPPPGPADARTRHGAVRSVYGSGVRAGAHSRLKAESCPFCPSPWRRARRSDQGKQPSVDSLVQACHWCHRRVGARACAIPLMPLGPRARVTGVLAFFAWPAFLGGTARAGTAGRPPGRRRGDHCRPRRRGPADSRLVPQRPGAIAATGPTRASAAVAVPGRGCCSPALNAGTVESRRARAAHI
jgi:hypothetical protein